MINPKVTIVGESNPYGGDGYFALYPSPAGCSGERLCCLILSMRRLDYLHVFCRTNLCEGSWKLRDARIKAQRLRSEAFTENGKLILLGAKVCKAFGVTYEVFSADERQLVLPHPSGLCRAWSVPGTFERAREAVKHFAPHLAELIGVYKGD